MTPQEENVRLQQQVNQELMAYLDAQRAANKETEKAAEAEAKIEAAATAVIQVFEKLYMAQLKYDLSIAKGSKGAATFNDSIDAMTEATQIAAVALSLLVPGGNLVKGVVAGLTFLATTAMKTSAEWKKLANEQADATYKAFQAFSKAGATGADGLKGFFNDVNRMRLNVHQMDAMAAAVANSAKDMTAMGGTVYKARGQFADLVQNMKPFEKGMLNLGLGYDEQAEALLGFMKMQADQTRGQQTDYGKLTSAAKKYIVETEVLTRVIGLSRKQQEEVQERQMANQRSGAALRELELAGRGDAVKLLKEQTKVYAKMGPAYEKGYNDLLSGQITTQEAQQLLMVTNGKALQDQTDIIEGRITSEKDAMAATQDTSKAIGDMQDNMLGLAKSGAYEDVFGPFQAASEAGKIAANDLSKSVEDARTQVDMLAGTIGGADKQINRYTDLLIEQNNKMLGKQEALNGAFSTSTGGVGTFAAMMEKAMKAVQPLINLFMKLVDVYTPLLMGSLDLLVGAISAVIKLMQGDFIGAFTDVKDGLVSFAKGYIETLNRVFSMGLDIITTFGKNLLATIEFFTGPLGEVFENVGTGLSNMYDNFSEGLSNLSTKMGDWAKNTWDSVTQSAAKFGENLLAGVEKITGPLGPVFDKVKSAFLGITDDVKAGMSKFSDAMVGMVTDIWNKLTNLIPGLKKAGEFAAAAVDTTRDYANQGMDAAKNAASAVSNFFSPAGGTGGGGGGGGGGATPTGAQIQAMKDSQLAYLNSRIGGGSAPAAAGGGAPAKTDGKGQTGKESGSVPVGSPPKGQGGSMGEDAIKDMIRQHEGYANYPYKDSKGLWTIGVGHLIGNGTTLPPEYAAYANNGRVGAKGNNTTPAHSDSYLMQLFEEDYQKHRKEAATVPMFDKMSQTMQGAFTDLAFNMGGAWWREWPVLQQQLKSKDAKAVADNLRNAKWASDVGPNRTAKVTGLVETGFQAAQGGVFDGPKSGYRATLHGNEAVIPLKDGAVPVSMSQEFNMTAANLGELVNQMKSNMAIQDRMVAVLEEIRRIQSTTADNTGRMAAYAAN